MAKNDTLDIKALNSDLKSLQSTAKSVYGELGKLNAIKFDKLEEELITIRLEVLEFTEDLKSLAEYKNIKLEAKFDADNVTKGLKDIDNKMDAAEDGAKELSSALENVASNEATGNLSLFSKALGGIKDVAKEITKVSLKEKLKDYSKAFAQDSAKQLIGAVTESVSIYAASAMNSELSTRISSVASSLAAGAMLGTYILPGWGTLIGAFAGAGIGAINGQAKIFEKEDDAFKSYYKTQYEDLKSESANILSQGIQVYAEREQYELPFTTLLGSAKTAEVFLKELKAFAIESTYDYDQLAAISKNLLSTGTKQEEVISLLTHVGDFGAAKGLGKNEMANTAGLLANLQLSNTASVDSLNALFMSGIPVWNALASKFGSEENALSIVNEGILSGTDAYDTIIKYLSTYSGSMDEQNNTYLGLKGTLEELRNDLYSEEGKGYAQKNEETMKSEIAFLQSDDGKLLESAYNEIGLWKAHLDDLSVQYKNNAMIAVLSGKTGDIFDEETNKRLLELNHYINEGGFKGEALEEAIAIAQNAYNADYDVQSQLKANLALAENLMNNAELQDSYWNAGYEMGVQFSNGMKNAQWVDGVSYIIPTNYNPYTTSISKLLYAYQGDKAPQFAPNINYNPYDNFPALLYGGERGLTAQENQNYEKSGTGTGTLNITGNNFYIREEADIEKVAKMMASKYLQSMALAQ